MAPFAESTNWADANGIPVYQIPKKNPKDGMKKPNITDARKLGLYPRVTSVIRLITAPILNDWRVFNAVETCWSYPPLDDNADKLVEPIEGYTDRIVKMIDADLEKSSERGKKIHADLNNWVAGGTIPEDDVSKHLIESLQNWGKANGVVAFTSENHFVNKELGFAGTDDLEAVLEDGRIIVLDLKTRKDAEKHNKPYDKDRWQLGGYSIGRNIEDPKRLVLVVCDQYRPQIPVAFNNIEDVKECREEFMAILNTWKLINRYDPTLGVVNE